MNKNSHLDQDQIIKAVIDLKDCDDTASAHLETCVHCRERISSFQKDLNMISKMAETFSCPPEPEILSLIRSKPLKFSYKGPILKPLAAFCLFVCVLAIVYVSLDSIKPIYDMEQQDPSDSYTFNSGIAFLFKDKSFDYFALSNINHQNEYKKARFDGFISTLIHYDDHILDITLFQILHKEVRK